MRDVAIVAAGQTAYGDFPDKGVKEMFADAFADMMASIDRDPDPEKIEAAYLGSLSAGGGFQLGNFAPLLTGHIGLPYIPSVHLESACASGGYALQCAVQAVASGAHEVVLAGGVEKMRDVSLRKTKYWLGISGDTEYERLAGLTFAGIFAVVANRYLHDYPLEKKHLSMVAVKNHKHGAMNPKAQFQREITLEQAMSGPVLADPLNLWDCCPTSDGATSVLVTTPERAREFTDEPVFITGYGAASDHLAIHDRDEITSLAGARKAAEKAYKMAGVTPEDIDLAEVHDCFTIAEVLAYGDLGFFKPEQIAKALEAGETSLGGRIPVNVSGGLKSKGHPIGATGTGMTCEIFNQLRGRAKKPERQVEGAKLALSHNMGGSGGSVTVFIYQRGRGRA